MITYTQTNTLNLSFTLKATWIYGLRWDNSSCSLHEDLRIVVLHLGMELREGRILAVGLQAAFHQEGQVQERQEAALLVVRQGHHLSWKRPVAHFPFAKLPVGRHPSSKRPFVVIDQEHPAPCGFLSNCSDCQECRHHVAIFPVCLFPTGSTDFGC